ncbi:uncharacterized protein [Ptychodera flava]|uniref:uncharacterized protein isoform X1 n=1 Tax=Ptychodera flava TaxID=63121 RepID=UPI00396A7B8F
MAAVPNACYAATNTYANFHKQKIIIETSDESTPPSSPNRTRYPSGGPGSPAKWINSALHYFHFPGRPRSESNPENPSTVSQNGAKSAARQLMAEQAAQIEHKSAPSSPLMRHMRKENSSFENFDKKI